MDIFNKDAKVMGDWHRKRCTSFSKKYIQAINYHGFICRIELEKSVFMPILDFKSQIL